MTKSSFFTALALSVLLGSSAMADGSRPRTSSDSYFQSVSAPSMSATPTRKTDTQPSSDPMLGMIFLASSLLVFMTGFVALRLFQPVMVRPAANGSNRKSSKRRLRNSGYGLGTPDYARPKRNS